MHEELVEFDPIRRLRELSLTKKWLENTYLATKDITVAERMRYLRDILNRDTEVIGKRIATIVNRVDKVTTANHKPSRKSLVVGRDRIDNFYPLTVTEEEFLVDLIDYRPSIFSLRLPQLIPDMFTIKVLGVLRKKSTIEKLDSCALNYLINELGRIIELVLDK